MEATSEFASTVVVLSAFVAQYRSRAFEARYIPCTCVLGPSLPEAPVELRVNPALTFSLICIWAATLAFVPVSHLFRLAPRSDTYMRNSCSSKEKYT